ncbi:hypothetical protein [Bradyrhizobium sp. BWA-3-5]|uniref:hypothetical protein n=1 Tax=Bradyrhizobium sp. BWA-3-5 TaxID=3080013 RepID=UPI00293EC022|nr:hypothetical protein [Bradyrhizobium sp. BWA-3-5]WOH64053.1 hypothetical protein RX331_26010 [Bradyrhizobium sp. BWA-3-5]WOH64179.1 hypothetical protein RX331_26800 [Bradyrhizobium sp. BWA-3-5]WOH70103.1 hypothetical protein RX331_37945 [Bradyrhizobium sp. BWA-3-5]
MTEEEMLKRDIETLKASMRLEYAEKANQILTPDELKAFRGRIHLLQADLDLLRTRLDGLKSEE